MKVNSKAELTDQSSYLTPDTMKNKEGEKGNDESKTYTRKKIRDNKMILAW